VPLEPTPPQPSPLSGAVRTLLLAAAVLVFLAGVQLFVFPTRTEEYFAWTVASPMTAVFLGASYWSAVGLEVTAARARGWGGARIAVPTVFVFTTATLVVTLVHLELFHLDADLELNTRLVTWGWIAVYVVVPVLMVLAVVAQRRAGFAAPPPTGLPALVRGVLLLLALGLAGLGLTLLLSPATGTDLWPWALTPLTARAVGAWLLGLGVAAGHAFVLDDRPSLRPLAVTGVLFGLLQAVALARFGEEVDRGARGVVYVAALALLTAVSAWALWPRPDRAL